MAITAAADVQVLFADNFSAPLDNNIWDYNHFSPINNPSFYGRTQIRQSLPSVSGGSVHLALDTFNPTGFSLYGTEIVTRQTFSPDGGGIAFEASARLVTATPGIVGAVFGYNFNQATQLHDEIDTELLGNDAAAGRNRAQTNIYDNEPSGAGHPQFVPVTDLTSFHVYRMEWYPTVVQWFIDGQLVREDTTHVPQDPMALHVNIWAPQTDWSEAYSALLQPTSNSASDATYFFDIDYVRVTSLALPPRITSGTLGGDLIFGSDDHFPGAAYDEIFFGNGGADIIYGGGGNDWVWASTSDNSNVTFFGQDGDDVLVGFGGNDWLQGDAGNDILIGGAGNDTLLGGEGNDSLWGGAGDDNLQGGDGDDVVVGGLAGEPGNDWLFGGAGDDILIGGNGNNTLIGDDGDDQLWSSSPGDVLNAGSGADLIVSNPAAAGGVTSIDPGLDASRDQIILDSDGTKPQDILTGGQSATQTSAGTDVIWYFSAGPDRLLVRAGDHTGALQSSFATFPEFGGLTGTLLTNDGAAVAFLAGTNTTAADLTANGALVPL